MMVANRRSRSIRSGRDDGAVLILFALAITAMMLIVALVIDLSVVRNTRQDSKSTTDAATAAGLQALASDGTPKPWRGVCRALAYLKANQRERTFSIAYKDGAGTPVGGDPCTSLLDQVCVADTPATWAWIEATDGEFVADIRSGYDLDTSGFPEDTNEYAADAGSATLGGCDQLAVIVRNRDDVYFGGVAGETGYETAIRSVGRVSIETEGKGVPAFLLLERTTCKVLSQSVGSGQEGIIVEAVSPTEPGIIHIDSAGTNGCTGGPSAEGNFTVYSGTLSSPTRAGIRVKGIGADPGILSLYSLQVGNTDHAYGTPDGVFATARPGNIISRLPVDDKYNPSSGTATITNLHAVTQPLANRSTAPDVTTYRTIEDPLCNGHSEVVPDGKVFVNCPSGYTPTAVTFTAATDIIFNGPVHVSGSSHLYMPAAQRIVVGGDSGGGLSVANQGLLGVNSVTPIGDADSDVKAACIGREGPAYSNTTQIVVFGGRPSGARKGALNITGRAALCQTSVYLAGPKSLTEYKRQMIDDGTYDSTCVADTPCPRDTGNVVTDANLDVSGYLRWSAPNQLTVPPPAGSVGVEDLALWSETAAQSDVNGILDIQGVIFVPNARMETRSPADLTPRDAQFIARSLKLLQGTLQMTPTSANSVEVDVLVGFSLIR